METPANHLELVFLTSTVTPAWGAGWAFTITVSQPRPVVSMAPPTRFRLALITS